ncbi:MAG: NUDIX domain-containing protein [Candidatus Woesearchaeota archaeon]
MTRIRIAAIIIQDGKLLLLNGCGSKKFWTPGGGCEEGETDIICLKRELAEEINVELKSAKFFGEFYTKSFYNQELDAMQRVYLVEIVGLPAPSSEIQNIKWFSKEELYSKEYADIAITQEREHILPGLIKAGVW